MFEIKKNEKNKSAVILSPERSEWVSRSHVTSVESVVNDGAKTKRYSAKRDLYARSPNGSRLKMTEKVLSFLRLRGASGAQGISATASYHEAHKRRFLLNPWILRFAFAPLRMTIHTLTLATVLSTSMVSESKAVSCDTGKKVCGTGCVAKSLNCNSCGGDCFYTEDGGAVTLYGTGAIASGYLPGKSPFAYSTSITSITADASSNFTSISDYAFHQSQSIKNVVLPNVTSIGEWAFGANSVESVNMPNVTSIGNSAFQGASSLQSVNMPNVTSVGSYAFSGASSLESVDMPNVTKIGQSAFENATSLQSVDMPNVTSVGSYAFAGASSLESVDMPNITKIGSYAFYNATSLQSVDMPNVETINKGAFKNATSLQSVDMPNVTKIGGSAFMNASSLSYAGLNQDGSVSIGANAFDGTPISNCTGTEAYCGSCPTGQSVMPGRGCVADCGTGYIVDNLTNRCVANEQPAQEIPSGGSGGTQGSGQATSAADCKNSGKYWQEGKCVSSCGASFKLNDGWCDRLRYTPAEAAQVLTDDNNNSVTITFKK